MKGKAVN